MPGLSYAVKVYIDLDNDGDFSDPSEDFSAYFLSASGDRGRSSVNDEYGPSKASVKLDNSSGDLSLYNSSSAFYQQLVPNRAIQIQVSTNSTTYSLFFGFITELEENREIGALNTVELTCLGPFEIWRKGSIRVDLLEGQTTDVLVDNVLDQIQVWGAPWPAGMRDIGAAYETINQFWEHRDAPIDVLRTAAKQDLGSHLYEAKDGSIVFRNRWWRSSQSLAATIGQGQDLEGRAFSLSASADDLIDRVEFQRAGLDVDSDTTTLYTLAPPGRAFYPGNDSARNTLNGQYSVGGKNVITPVAVTDYTFNDQPDGSGTDKTAQVTVDSFTSYGGGFSCTFNVLDSSPVYIQTFNVRGQAVRRSNDERTIEINASSPSGSEQVLQDEFAFNDNVDNIAALARLEAETLSKPQPQPPIMVVPSSDTQHILCLGLDLGDKVRLIDNIGPQNSAIDDEFFIEYFEWEYEAKKLPVYTYSLWHTDKAHGNLFKVSPDSPAAILSEIATDVATVFDRIGV